MPHASKKLIRTLTYSSVALGFQLASASPNAQQISQLRSQIKNQQNQIEIQNKRLDGMQSMLIHMNRKKSGPTKEAHTANHFSVVRVSPAQDSIIKQASSSGDSFAIDKPQMLFKAGKFNLSFSGQISILGFQADDGKYNRSYIGTNSALNNRLQLDTKYEINRSLEIGSHIEFGFNTNPTNAINQFSPTSMDIDIRKFEAYVHSEHWGEIDFGRGKTASDDTAFTDLSGTKIAARAAVNDIGGGLYFGGVPSNPQVNDSFNALDGLGHASRIRYDTPSFYGFVVSSSITDDHNEDIALKFGQQWGDTKFAFQIAYASPQSVSSGANIAHGNQFNGSTSLLLPFGVSLTAAAGEINAKVANRKNPNFFYLKPGYQFHCFETGLTAFSVDFGRYFNLEENNDRGTAQGIQLVQNFNSLDMVLYALYRNFALKRTNNNFHSINLFAIGALYRF